MKQQTARTFAGLNALLVSGGISRHDLKSIRRIPAPGPHRTRPTLAISNATKVVADVAPVVPLTVAPTSTLVRKTRSNYERSTRRAPKPSTKEYVEVAQFDNVALKNPKRFDGSGENPECGSVYMLLRANVKGGFILIHVYGSEDYEPNRDGMLTGTIVFKTRLMSNNQKFLTADFYVDGEDAKRRVRVFADRGFPEDRYKPVLEISSHATGQSGCVTLGPI